MKAGVLLVSILIGLSPYPVEQDRALYDALAIVYTKPDFKVFSLAMKGYRKLEGAGELPKPDILTLIDFDKSSANRRLWVINIKEQRVVFQSLVAHGKKTGNVYAKSFSNKLGSHQSSLGFYITGDTYIGKHGLSLYLDGMEPGINDQARARSIVMHGANYVSKEFISKYGRLGRSFGCPSVPISKHKDIINYIKGGTCFFIYHSNEGYQANTQILDQADF